MNLIELKNKVQDIIRAVYEDERDPKDVPVSIQVEKGTESFWSCDIELIYDNDIQASGCVIVGEHEALRGAEGGGR